MSTSNERLRLEFSFERNGGEYQEEYSEGNVIWWMLLRRCKSSTQRYAECRAEIKVDMRMPSFMNTNQGFGNPGNYIH